MKKIEVEKKFLLKSMPFPRMDTEDYFQEHGTYIEQHYVEHAGERFRIRKCVNNKHSSFYKTAKKMLRPGMYEEDEVEISKEEFHIFVKSSIRSIKKIRILLDHPGNETLKWEIDYFVEGIRLIIAEIEFPNIDVVSPPGDTFEEIVKEKNISILDVISAFDEMNVDKNTDFDYYAFLDGDVEITDDIAKVLEDITNVPSNFWISRDANYRKQKNQYESFTIPDFIKNVLIMEVTDNLEFTNYNLARENN